ncbi:signal transduction histidine kinase [Thermocatellispora tengchongensis]|uniref:histidine kinase n=1 Tax=Thermocatellispora tengchongensis TaxID=1073253 RepID=A0A840PEL9_9ACTN|nr:ATP-binding protein [Thermocatellispora tengchongensis]MBB5136383.1 signal transduction histidine kinase [Thermocatellispora tengchongensis]
MSAHVSNRTRRRFSPGERAAVVLLGTMVVVVLAWLWAVSTAPEGAKGLMALVGGVAGVLLAVAFALVANYAATVKLLRERARLADAQATRLEREALRMAEETMPALGRQVREGVSAVEALAGVPQPSDGTLQQLLRAAGHELDVLEREVAAARAAREGFEAEVARLAGDTLPELAKRVQNDRVPVSTALEEVRQPIHAPLRSLLNEAARQLGEGERRGAAAMAACASAAARVQAQATSLLARLRELEDEYGTQEEIFADLLDLDHRISQMGRLADNIALLSGGRSGRRWTRPIVMESVLRGAMGRIGAYRRIRLHSTSTVAVAGYAAEGVMHALAELMDNAATFSAHGTEVHVYVDEEDTGVVVTIEDSGLGMRSRERHRAAKLVSEPLDLRMLSGTRLGLAVVGRLVDKYGLTVNFRPSARGGTGVVMLIPRRLITQPRPASTPPPSGPDATARPGALPGAAPVPEPSPDEDRPGGDGLLPRRRRGQTLAEAMAAKTRQAPAARPAREAHDSAARFAAFRQAGARGRAPSASGSEGDGGS